MQVRIFTKAGKSCTSLEFDMRIYPDKKKIYCTALHCTALHYTPVFVQFSISIWIFYVTLIT